MYNYNDYFSESTSSLFDLAGNYRALGTVSFVSFLLAVIGGLLLFFLFLSKTNEDKFTGFLGCVYEFLNFKKMLAEGILKLFYLISASFITLYSIGILLFTEGGSVGAKFISFLLLLIVGNGVIRLFYEFALVILIICKNTTEMNRKLGNNNTSLSHTVNTVSDDQIPDQQSCAEFCRFCGNGLHADERYCPHCGKEKESN